MGKFDGILICTDLDGTLYKKDKTVSRENREAIEYFKREGGFFTFITGRLYYYAQEAYAAASPNVPYGTINGGGLYDGVEDCYIYTLETPHKVLELVACIDEKFPDVGIQICGFERTYFAKENDITLRFRRLTGVPPLSCDYREVDFPIAKIIFCIATEEQVAEVEKTLRAHPLAEEFDFVRSERTLFEILPKGVHKGFAIEKLAEYLGVRMEKTVAIGDYDNDIAMLTAAGCGVAVENACPAAREAADYITVSNEEHAIARLIYGIENGEFGNIIGR